MGLFDGLIDVAISPDGDLLVENNDLKQVRGFEWFAQEVNKILRSGNDWYFAPNAGASLDMFYGQNNTREIAKQVEERIITKITQQGINFPAELVVRTIPISRDEIKVYINLIYENQSISVDKLVFDLQKGTLKETEEIEKNTSKLVPSKHPFATRFMFT